MSLSFALYANFILPDMIYDEEILKEVISNLMTAIYVDP